MSWIEKVQKLMNGKNWNQKDLSRESGVTEASVCRYLKGERKPRIDIIVNFAKALGVSADYLISDDTTIESPFNNIATAIARNGSSLTPEEQTRLIQMILQMSGGKNVSGS